MKYLKKANTRTHDNELQIVTYNHLNCNGFQVEVSLSIEINIFENIITCKTRKKSILVSNVLSKNIPN